MKTFTSTQEHKRNYLLDLLKGICAICVILQHTKAANCPQPFYLTFPFWVYYGVPIFMFISGYVWAISYKKNSINRFVDAYKPQIILKRFLRFFIPWLLVFLAFETTTMIQIGGWDTDFFKHIIVGGGMWNGDYYIVMVWQLILLYPIFYFLIQRYKFAGFCGFYIFNVLFECFRWATGMPELVYHYLLFRLTSFLAFGTYLGVSTETKFSFKNWKIDIALFVSFAIGVVYLCMIYFNNWNPTFFVPGKWREHNFIGALYILPILFILVKKCNIKHKGWGYLGKTCYGIFLMQMILFAFLQPSWAFQNYWAQLFIDLTVCIAAGICFYYLIEQLLTNNLLKLIFRKRKKQVNEKK